MRVIARPDDCCAPPRVPTPRKGEGNARLVAALRAAADPTRLAILQILGAAGAPVCACDLVARFDLGQPTVSHHLRVLRRAGLVDAARRGIWIHYELRPAGIALLRRGLDALAADAGRGGG